MPKKISKKIKRFCKRHWRLGAVLFLAIIFFLATSSLSYYTQSYGENGDFVKWASPDETANYIFAKLYGQEGRIYFEENYNLYTNDIMHPRSFRSDYGYLKPVSFLGIILIFGKIVTLTSYKVLPYLTPLFASIALVYYYLLVKKIFGRHAYLP